MIVFNYETDFQLQNDTIIEQWINDVITNHKSTVGEINYIFCDDTYLHKLNVEFLDHDTLTDIISFDNCVGSIISGDIFISIERIQDNAKDFNVSFEDELHRVMIHGILHYLGFKDKSPEQQAQMTLKENESLSFLNIC